MKKPNRNPMRRAKRPSFFVRSVHGPGGSGGQATRANHYPPGVRSARRGLLTMAVVMLLISAVLLAALFNIQIYSHDKYSSEAAAQHFKRKTIEPERGQITDRNGLTLAVTTYEYTIGMTPGAVRSWLSDGPERAEIGREIARILDLDPDKTVEQLGRDDAYIMLKKHVDRETTDQLKQYRRDQSIGGLVFDVDLKRDYPEGKIGASVVGLADRKSGSMRGFLGIEQSYDEELRGTPGYTFRQTDNYAGVQLPLTEAIEQPAQDGHNVQLSLDMNLQAFCERVIREAVKAYDVRDGAEIVVLDTQTGAVLAMANSKTFDANDPYGKPAGWTGAAWDPFQNKDQMEYVYRELWPNRAISRLYEPGSTYKAITVASALEEKIYQPGEVISDDPLGFSGYGDAAIVCWSEYEPEGNHGYETLLEAFGHSCNPVMARTALRLGIRRFYDYVRAFGHRQLTGIDLPAESLPIMHPEDSNNVIEMCTWAFGESAAITPLHLANAYSVFGNGGYLMVPHVASRITDRKGNTVREIKPEIVRQVLSKETAQTMMQYLREPVEDGSMDHQSVPGFGFAGKTSTSAYPDDKNPDLYHQVRSFCSVSPYWAPTATVLVVLHDTYKLGSTYELIPVNAIVTRKVMDSLGVEPSYTDYEKYDASAAIKVPDLIGKDMNTARRWAFYNRILTDSEPNMPNDGQIQYQYPPAGTLMNKRGSIYVGYSKNEVKETVTVPDLSGMSYQKAWQLAERLGLNLKCDGDVSTVVSGQSAEAGKKVKKYSVVDLQFG